MSSQVSGNLDYFFFVSYLFIYNAIPPYCFRVHIFYLRNNLFFVVLTKLDAVNNLESNGHALNGNSENGVASANNVQINLHKTDQDIVRLIGQYLKIVGLEYVLLF